jgi:hypothetical protein
MIPSLAYTEALRGNIMAQRKPEEPITLEQVLRLVEKLSPEDQQKLLLTLDRNSRSQEWRNLVAAVDEDNKELPSLSDEEIAEEVRAIKHDRKSRSAQSSD